MKKTIFILTVVVLISFGFASCFKNKPAADEIPRYSNIDDIIIPSDQNQFRLVYRLSSYTDYPAVIEFDTSAVWEIKRLGPDRFFQLRAERSDGSSEDLYDILDSRNEAYIVGLEGGVQYNFLANRISGEDISITVIIEFTKTDEDYEIFSPKI